MIEELDYVLVHFDMAVECYLHLKLLLLNSAIFLRISFVNELDCKNWTLFSQWRCFLDTTKPSAWAEQLERVQMVPSICSGANGSRYKSKWDFFWQWCQLGMRNAIHDNGRFCECYSLNVMLPSSSAALLADPGHYQEQKTRED